MARKDHGQMRKVYKALKDQGWTWETTGGGHLKFTSPEGEIVFASATPRSARSFKDFVCDLRRRGLEYSW